MNLNVHSPIHFDITNTHWLEKSMMVKWIFDQDLAFSFLLLQITRKVLVVYLYTCFIGPNRKGINTGNDP